MARPTQFPEWASNGVNVVEPSEGKKDEGWLDGERPPAKWFNWLFKLINDWIADFVEEHDAEASTRYAADSGLQTAIDTETSTRSTADTTLQTQIDAIKKMDLRGCNHGRSSASVDTVNFNNGYAVDITGSIILEMPRHFGFTYSKTVVNNTGYQTGHDTNGLASGITAVAGMHLYIFLIRLPSGNFDIGYDTSLTAANLTADSNCLATHYRRIGHTQVKTVDTGVTLHPFNQDGDYHWVDKGNYGISYSTTVADWGAYISGDNIYLPAIDCQAMYAVEPPTVSGGGDTSAIVLPMAVSNSKNTMLSKEIYHAFKNGTVKVSSGFLMHYSSAAEPAMFCFAMPYTNATVLFNILGYIDSRDRMEFPG